MLNLEFATVRMSDGRPRSEHFVGLPPELTGGKETRRVLPTAQVIVLQQDDQGGIFLTRFTSQGEEVGDTWHTDITEARAQAEFEYDGMLSEWQAVPDGVNDTAALVRRVAR